MKTINKNYTPGLLAILIVSAFSFIILKNYFKLIDNDHLLSQISLLGFPVLVIFIPYSLILLNDSVGWYNCFRNKMPKISIRKLFLLRLATETLQTSLPGGAAYAELIRPYLLMKHLRLEYTESISANIITKINILLSQVVFLVCGLLILIINFRKNITSVQFLPETLLYLISVLFILLIILFSYQLFRKNLLLRITGIVGKINLKIMRKLLNKIQQPSIEINNILSGFFKKNKTRLFLSMVFFFITWIFMAFESLIILKIIGVNANIFQMIVMESLISLVRITFFFLPGAVGPMDVSIIMLFSLVGIPDPLLNSFLFIILKRFKELVWILAGYILLIFFGLNIKTLFGVKQRKMEFSPQSFTKF